MQSTSEGSYGNWSKVEQRIGSVVPCQRSLHSAAVWKDNMLVFGGYDGHHRLNDLYAYNFSSCRWSFVQKPNPPSPRDRHTAVIFENKFVVFGGFDGTARVEDLHLFDLVNQQWQEITSFVGIAPTARHSHSAVQWGNSMFVFGGYDGSYRCDFHEFNFPTLRWSTVNATGEVPRARYRSTCVVWENKMILHGGHDGIRHLQDTHVFDFKTRSWTQLDTTGLVPSPRDSHVSVIFGSSMFMYGGSTGSAVGDLHELHLPSQTWRHVEYRKASSNDGAAMLVFGGSLIGSNSQSDSQSLAAVLSGASSPNLLVSRSLSSDVGSFGLISQATEERDGESVTGNGLPLAPFARSMSSDAGVSISDNADNNSVAAAGSDAYGVRAGSGTSATPTRQGRSNNDSENAPAVVVTPGNRFCHAGVVYGNSLYIFGGYDSSNRLNDFYQFQIVGESALPPSTLFADLKALVNCELLSDIKFIVEDTPVFAHRVLCLRSPYFRNMLTGEYMESKANEIVIQDMKLSIFVQFLEFVYCDFVNISYENAMELFEAADRFGADRLKKCCEAVMLSALTVETAGHIFYVADEHHAASLRERALHFIVSNFDNVSKTTAFEDMLRANVDLVLEILHRR